jgi:thiamine monophosphate kinase
MDHTISLWQRLKIGTVLAVVGALGINAAIGLAMLHSPDSALMVARHGGPVPHMVADLGSLSTVQVCARRVPA